MEITLSTKMILKYAVIFLIAGICTATPRSRQKRYYVCPQDFIRLGNHCYYFSEKLESWKEAEFDCQDRNSELAELKTKYQDRTLREYLSRLAPVERWIGGVYNWKDMDWHWASGANMTYRAFIGLDPRKHNSQSLQWHCTATDPNSKNRWAPHLCMIGKRFICQKNLENVDNEGRRRLLEEWNRDHPDHRVNEIEVPPPYRRNNKVRKYQRKPRPDQNNTNLENNTTENDYKRHKPNGANKRKDVNLKEHRPNGVNLKEHVPNGVNHKKHLPNGANVGRNEYALRPAETSIRTRPNAEGQRQNRNRNRDKQQMPSELRTSSRNSTEVNRRRRPLSDQQLQKIRQERKRRRMEKRRRLYEERRRIAALEAAESTKSTPHRRETNLLDNITQRTIYVDSKKHGRLYPNAIIEEHDFK